MRSELSVPMIARKRLVGVIDVQSTRPGAFNDYDRAMLRLIGGRVAAAIDNAQLYRRAERQYRTIRTLSRISQEFSSILDIDELLSKIASSVRGLINYDAFSILLVDDEQTVPAPPLQHPLRSARQHRQHSARQGHHRRGRHVARNRARARHRHRPALHRLASRISGPKSPCR